MLSLILLACDGDKTDDTQLDAWCAGYSDACTQQACEACTDACGSDCVVLESYPEQWACPDQSWDVYDFCPDWTPESDTDTDTDTDTGLACTVADLEFSAEVRDGKTACTTCPVDATLSFVAVVTNTCHEDVTLTTNYGCLSSNYSVIDVLGGSGEAGSLGCPTVIVDWVVPAEGGSVEGVVDTWSTFRESTYELELVFNDGASTRAVTRFDTDEK